MATVTVLNPFTRKLDFVPAGFSALVLTFNPFTKKPDYISATGDTTPGGAADVWLLEDGLGGWLLEDGSGLWLLEA